MVKKQEDVKFLRGQVERLTKQIKNYEWGIKANTQSNLYLLEQNGMLLQFSQSIMICCQDLSKNIDRLNKRFARR